MTIGDADPTFVDTNILVFATTTEAPLHRQALSALQSLTLAGAEFWLSRQVMREYIATLTRPQSFAVTQSLPSVLGDIRDFERLFRVVEDGPDVTMRLLSLLEQVPVGGKRVHDANIVATMLAHSIPRLLTHNADDFVRFAGYIEVIPLVPR
jgi:predicted nucleic acid-binding protein